MKISKVVFPLLVLLLLFSASQAFCGGAQEEQGGEKAVKPVVLRFSEHDAPSGIRADATKLWFEEIKKQTGGQVVIEDYWSSSLFKSKEALKGCQDGVADIVHISPAHYPKLLAAWQAYRLFPEGPDKRENINWFYDKCFEEIPELNENLEANNVMLVFTGGGLPGSFVSSKKIVTFDDIQGQKWRAGNKFDLERIENVGAIPTSVPWSDVYMAIQTGVIDGCFTNLDGIRRTKMDEAGKNLLITRSLWWVQPNIYVMNLDKWNSLTKEQQDGMMKATEIAEEYFVDLYNNEIDKIVAFQKSQGWTVNFINDKDLAAWTDPALIEKMQAEWVVEYKELLDDPADVLNTMSDLLEQAIAREK